MLKWNIVCSVARLHRHDTRASISFFSAVGPHLSRLTVHTSLQEVDVQFLDIT